MAQGTNEVILEVGFIPSYVNINWENTKSEKHLYINDSNNVYCMYIAGKYTAGCSPIVNINDDKTVTFTGVYSDWTGPMTAIFCK